MDSLGICYLRRGLKISINGPYLVVVLLLLRPRVPRKASAFSREVPMEASASMRILKPSASGSQRRGGSMKQPRPGARFLRSHSEASSSTKRKTLRFSRRSIPRGLDQRLLSFTYIFRGAQDENGQYS